MRACPVAKKKRELVLWANQNLGGWPARFALRNSLVQIRVKVNEAGTILTGMAGSVRLGENTSRHETVSVSDSASPDTCGTPYGRRRR